MATNEKENSSDVLSVRIGEDLEIFKEKSLTDLGKPYAVLVREMVKAFNEDRLRIIPTSEQKEGLKLYQG